MRCIGYILTSAQVYMRKYTPVGIFDVWHHHSVYIYIQLFVIATYLPMFLLCGLAIIATLNVVINVFAMWYLQ